MEIITITGIAVGLAMDAFAVSIVSGSAFKDMCVRCALRMAVFFGAFQAFMPLLGYLAGNTFAERIVKYDHWVAFALLVLIGGKMIYESFKIGDIEKKAQDPSCPVTLLMLSIATSIDALAVGVTLSLITQHIYATVILIGVITFILSYIGYEIGKRIGHFFEKKIEILGGLILIIIGVKILITHLVAT
ncbi:MAG: manganese efflux pump [Planctomycetes bacterium]|nr:manganese efflux pump [Planctomycetota bacterium]